MPRRYEDTVPAAPFVAWLADQLEHTDRHALAQRLGVSERGIYRYKNQRSESQRFEGGKRRKVIAHVDVFERARVEDMLFHAGLSLDDVADFADKHGIVGSDAYRSQDVELEPDQFCRTCWDTVTPISLICPWCETKLVPPEELEDAA